MCRWRVSAEEILCHLNWVRQTIKLTMEQKEDETLPFLDKLLMIRRREDGTLDVSCLQESHHPTYVKRGVVRCLHSGARVIVNTQDNLQNEVDHLARVLKQNGHPTNASSQHFCPTHTRNSRHKQP